VLWGKKKDIVAMRKGRVGNCGRKTARHVCGGEKQRKREGREASQWKKGRRGDFPKIKKKGYPNSTSHQRRGGGLST